MRSCTISKYPIPCYSQDALARGEEGCKSERKERGVGIWVQGGYREKSDIVVWGGLDDIGVIERFVTLDFLDFEGDRCFGQIKLYPLV